MLGYNCSIMRATVRRAREVARWREGRETVGASAGANTRQGMRAWLGIFKELRVSRLGMAQRGDGRWWGKDKRQRRKARLDEARDD